MIRLSSYQKDRSIARINEVIRAFKERQKTLVQLMLREDRFSTPNSEEREFLKHVEETIIYLVDLKQKIRQDRLEEVPQSIQMIFEFKR